MVGLKEYSSVVGTQVIDELKLLAERLEGKTIQNVNSAAVGGGVAEILSRAVPLLNELGVEAKWDVIKGTDRFFEATKKFHNALHGRKEKVTKADYDVFMEVSEQNLKEFETYGDIVFIHDPQPVVLVKKKKHKRWIWRCHIDITEADKKVWEFINKHVVKYDAVVYSAPAFVQPLKMRQFLITPSIDPLSDKNKELPQETIDKVLDKYGIDKKKPIIAQISRYDYLKDPVRVIDVYRMVKKYTDCQLVFAGNKASDDPESDRVIAEVKTKAGKDPDIHPLVIPHDTNDIDVNAIQRAASVILQKSLREGFGLVVTEALWKGKPVVASAVGGIPLQIKHKYSGLLCHSVEGAAFGVKQFLNSPAFAKRLGANARENVRRNFLLTRHLREYMLLYLSMYNHEGIVYL